MADVDASEVGKEVVGDHVEFVMSGAGVNAVTTGCRVLKAAVVGGSVNHASGAGSEVGRAVWSAVSAGLVVTDATVGFVARLVVVGLSVRGSTVDSVVVLRKVRMAVVGVAARVWLKVPVG